MKLTKTRVHGRTRWRVEYRLDGKRNRPTFATKALAEEEIRTLQNQRQVVGDVWLALTPRERNEVLAIYAETKEAGLTLRQVWEGYKRNGAKKPIEKRTFEDAIRDFLEAKERTGRAHHYIRCLASSLNQFTNGRAKQPVCETGLADLEAWLEGRTPTDRDNKGLGH
jgi:hypothetical protein